MKRFTPFLAIAYFFVSPVTLASQQIPANPTFLIVAQASKITAKTAQDTVWRLPEVQQKVREIQRLSKGKVRVGQMVESEPTRSEPYYTVQIYENHPEHVATIYRFRISSPGGIITVFDDIRGEYMSLRQWRNSQRKTRRG